MEPSPKNQKGRKLIYLLSTLSAEERKDFRAWLRSPLLGKSPHSVKILEVIEKKVLKKGLASIPYHLFATVLAPENQMDARKEEYIRIRLVQFQNRLLEFIATRRCLTDTSLRSRHLLEEAIARGWEKYIPEFFQRAVKGLGPVESGEIMLRRMQLEEILNGYLAQRAVKGMDTHLGKVHASLDDYFILQKLKFACAAANLKLAWNEDQEVALLGPVLQEVEKDPLQWSMLTRAYFHACKMLAFAAAGSEESTLHFEQLLGLMEDPLQYERDDAHTFFLYAQNYCTIRFFQGQNQYLIHLKTLYDLVLNSGMLLENGRLSPNFYTNTVMLMCRFGELEWTEKFIFQFRELIYGESRGEELAFTYNLAVLRFYQEKYQATIGLLFNEIGRFEDPLYSVGARIYLCRALWEQGDWEWLIATLHSFRQFLSRNTQLGKPEKANTLKFIQYLEKMARIKSGNPQHIRESLRNVRAQLETEGNRQVFAWVAGALDRSLQ